MKLIRNTEYDNIYTYFPGIDYPASWTLQNPAVYSYVKNSENVQQVNIPSFKYMSEEPKYLLFKAQGEVHYQLQSSGFNFNSAYDIFLYDYLHYKLKDAS